MIEEKAKSLQKITRRENSLKRKNHEIAEL